MHEFWNANREEPQNAPSFSTNQSRNQRSCPPNEGEVKLNCDGAFSENNLKEVIALVARDENGDLLFYSARVFPYSLAFQAESLAVVGALDLILALDIQKAIIESDNLTVVNSCLGGPTPWQICEAMCDIKKKIRQHGNVEIRWIRREENKSADVVEKLALKGELPIVWRWMPSIKLRVAMLDDRLVFHSSSLN